jgi:hypothetical protein
MNIQKYMGLLNSWGGLCIICGEPFCNPNSVTREHIIPKSKGGSQIQGNVAPAHFHCNQIKGNMPLLKAAKVIQEKKKQMGSVFSEWANSDVPDRCYLYLKLDSRFPSCTGA